MPTFSAPDGTELSYRRFGRGAPLVCLPGGPMRASEYLGDLGGLDAHRTLVRLDLRGTGSSGVPSDQLSYRCDRQVEDVEGLRAHLGLETFDLLAHSAGANLALQYAARHPGRVSRLVLATPSTRALGISFTPEDRAEAAALLADRPWQPAALAALEATLQGVFDFEAIAPVIYGRWGAAEQAHAALEEGQRNDGAAQIFGTDGAFDPAATRAALAAFTAPVLVLAAQYDGGPTPARAAETAAALANSETAVVPGTGHFPWVGDSTGFVTAVREFLDR
ncbi:alpha/beta hydrolase [Kitasatospora sp. NPDC002040]|uniref:alpha/beta fold hydrolase n=1 Tax=Kitasatospora sp. NPDC002040 TaxID=3154661 RepID=UPI0033177788